MVIKPTNPEIFHLDETFFNLFDYVTRRSGKLRFQKKKKKKHCQTLPQNCLFLVLSEISRENYYFETLLCFIKLCKNYDKKCLCIFFSFAIGDLKKIS